jgi:hypothetical protein
MHNASASHQRRAMPTACRQGTAGLGGGPDGRDTPVARVALGVPARARASACWARGPRRCGRLRRLSAQVLLRCGRPPSASACARARLSPSRTPCWRAPVQRCRSRVATQAPGPGPAAGAKRGRVVSQKSPCQDPPGQQTSSAPYIAGQGGNRGDGPQDALLQIPSVMKSLVMLREAASEEIARCVYADGG